MNSLFALLAIVVTGKLWINPVASLVITATIIYSTWGLFRDAMQLALQGVPPGIDISAVRGCLETRPGVAKVHDVHVWTMSTTQTALTAHLVKPDGKLDDNMLHEICHEMEDRFQIQHVTLQLEQGNGTHRCRQAADEVI